MRAEQEQEQEEEEEEEGGDPREGRDRAGTVRVGAWTLGTAAAPGLAASLLTWWLLTVSLASTSFRRPRRSSI